MRGGQRSHGGVADRIFRGPFGPDDNRRHESIIRREEVRGCAERSGPSADTHADRLRGLSVKDYHISLSDSAWSG